MKSRVIKIIASFLVFVLILGIVIAFAGYRKVDETVELLNPIDKDEVKEMTNPNISEEVISTLKENWTVALFGIDSREEDDLTSSNSDTIMIASVNNKTGAINIVSVYRDTCLKTGDNRYRKVNEAYAIGGPKKAVEVLNENLDLQIDDYVAVNWSAVATAINILGGIDIEVTDDELKWINGYITETVESTGIGSVHLEHSGLQTLDGIQAVAYARIRYTSGNDFKRTERQRTVLNAALNKAKSADWATINNIIVTVFPMTASSIDTNDIISLGKNILKYHFVDTSGFPFEHIEKRVDGADYVFPDDLTENVSELHDFLYGTEEYDPSDEVKEISKRVDNKKNGGNSQKKPAETQPQPVVTEPETIAETEAQTIPPETVEETIPKTTSMYDIPEEERTDENYGPGFVNDTQETESAAEKTLPEETLPEESISEENLPIETTQAESETVPQTIVENISE